MPENTTRHVLDLINRWTDMRGGCGGKGYRKMKLIKKCKAGDGTSF